MNKPTQKKPKVAILMATHNGEEWLDQQIASVLSQRNIRGHLMIADDASTDETKARLKYYLRSPYITILPEKKSGNAALNFFRLLTESVLDEYDYVALADQDDIWMPDKIERAINVMRIASADGYSSNVIAFWPNGREKIIVKSQPQTEFDFLFESAGPGCTFVLTNKLIRELQAFLKKEAKNLTKIALHDWLIYAFARAKNYHWIIDSQCHMRYRQHPQNAFGANNGLKAMFKRWRMMTNGWYRGQVLAIADMIGMHNNTWMLKLARLNLNDRWQLFIQTRSFRRRLRDRFALQLLIICLIKK